MKNQEAKVDYGDFEKMLFLSKLHDKPLVLTYNEEKKVWEPQLYDGRENGHTKT